MFPLTKQPFPSDVVELDLQGEHTKMNPADLRALLWLLSELKGNIVEVGCSDGQTTELLARRFPDKTIYACDFTSAPIPHLEQISEQPTPLTIAAHARGLPNVTIIDGLSSQIPYHTFRKVGVIFIDADHRYDAVREDTERALATIALGPFNIRRMLIWHDCYDGGPEWLGVKRYLETEITPLHQVYWIEGTWLAYAIL